jgi:hypothetical protein
VAGLVYLDAIGDLEDDPPADKEWAALQQQMPPGLRPQPKCDPVDASSFAAFRRTRTCPMGFILPESEFRQQFHEVDGAVGDVTAPHWVMRAIGKQQVFRKDYSNIRVPVLVMLEFPRFPATYTPKSSAEPRAHRTLRGTNQGGDRKAHGQAETSRARHPFRGRPGRRTLLWITREAQVLHEIHAFIRALP